MVAGRSGRARHGNAAADRKPLRKPYEIARFCCGRFKVGCAACRPAHGTASGAPSGRSPAPRPATPRRNGQRLRLSAGRSSGETARRTARARQTASGCDGGAPSGCWNRDGQHTTASTTARQIATDTPQGAQERGARARRARTRPAARNARAGGCGAFPAIVARACPSGSWHGQRLPTDRRGLARGCLSLPVVYNVPPVTVRHGCR